MSVKFQDYYKTLGVERGASQEEIQRAYRKLARQYHPDVNKAPEADAKFKQVTEAYEVLKDPATRKRYDELGADYRGGQDFRPPPEWGWGAGAPRGGRGRPGGRRGKVDFEGAGADGFSDFFETFFGAGGGARRAGGGDSPFADFVHDFDRRGGGEPFGGGPAPGRDHEAELTVTLADLASGGSRRITLRTGEGPAGGAGKTIDVRLPPGTRDGSVIRLAGQGEAGGGGRAGDLLLRIRLVPDPRYRVEGDDLVAVAELDPAQAALGARVDVPTLDGAVTVTIPAGTGSGQRLRLRGKGLPMRGGAAGDLYVEVRIVVPKTLTPAQRAAYEALAKAMNQPAS